jgi:hypothetical protein
LAIQASETWGCGFLPAPAIAQRQTVIALSQREIWVELQRRFELGQRIDEPLGFDGARLGAAPQLPARRIKHVIAKDELH